MKQRLWKQVLPGLLTIAAAANAAILTVPPGLNPGDQYRIIFVTSTTRDATSINITDYDAFVNGAANAPGSLLQPLGATWLAVGSTNSVSAFAHVGGNFALPVFLLSGALVATNGADLWDGTLANSVSLNELGNLVTHVAFKGPWTGTLASGIGCLGGCVLGGGSSLALRGNENATTFNRWLDGDLDTRTFQGSLYGISGTLTVPGAVPEPDTLYLIAVGVTLLMVGRGRKLTHSQE